MVEDSLLKPYCVAIVAKDKDPDGDIIQFFNVEHLFLEEGKVDEIKDSTSIEVTDSQGKKKKVNIERTAVQEARWFSNGSDGRQSAPNVVSGESVRIYRYGDSDVFYWVTMFREPSLRRLEHVVHAYSNLRSGRDAFEQSSSYGSLFSTRDKKILFWTSQSDGEKFSYQFNLDTKASTWTLSDNVSNAFGITSLQGKVWMRNDTDNYFELDKDISRLRAKKSVNIETEEVHTTGSVHVRKVVYSPAFVVGKDNTDIGRPETVEVGVVGAMSRASTFSTEERSRPWKTGFGDHVLSNGVGVFGNNCLIETGVRFNVEIGDYSSFNFYKKCKIEFDECSKRIFGEHSCTIFKEHAHFYYCGETNKDYKGSTVINFNGGANINLAGGEITIAGAKVKETLDTHTQQIAELYSIIRSLSN